MKVIMTSNKMKEYFQIYQSWFDKPLYVLIKNLELKKYCENNNPVYTDDEGYTIGSVFKFVDKVPEHCTLLMDGHNGITDVEYINFEFDNEEDAFYFKLKYC